MLKCVYTRNTFGPFGLKMDGMGRRRWWLVVRCVVVRIVKSTHKPLTYIKTRTLNRRKCSNCSFSENNMVISRYIFGRFIFFSFFSFFFLFSSSNGNEPQIKYVLRVEPCPIRVVTFYAPLPPPPPPTYFLCAAQSGHSNNNNKTTQTLTDPQYIVHGIYLCNAYMDGKLFGLGLWMLCRIYTLKPSFQFFVCLFVLVYIMKPPNIR